MKEDGRWRLTSKGTSEAAAAEKALKHLLGAHLVLPHVATTEAGGAAAAAAAAPEAAAEGVGLGARALEARVGVGAEAVELVALLLVAEHAEGAADHLEGLVGVLVAVLVRVGQQGLLAVGLLDLGVGARRAGGEAQDVVEGRRRAAADAQDRRLLLHRVLALLVALLVVPVARRVVAARVGARGGCAGGHGRVKGLWWSWGWVGGW